MYHSFKNHLKDRLENRKAWSYYFLYCLRHWEISDKVSGEYFKDKPLLSIILKTYYLPINIVKFFYRIRTWHYYLKTETEIDVLNKELEEEDAVVPKFLTEFSKDKGGRRWAPLNRHLHTRIFAISSASSGYGISSTKILLKNALFCLA